MEVLSNLLQKMQRKTEELPKTSEILPSKNVIKKDPELSKADKKYSMAQLAFKVKDYRVAIMHASDAIKSNPKMSGTFVIIAKCYAAHERYTEAMRVLTRGKEFSGGIEIFEEMENVLEYQHKRKEIIKMWKDFITSSRRKDLGYRALGIFYEDKEENLGKAVEYYIKTLELNEVNFEIYERLANIYFTEKKFNECINTYNKMLFSKHSKEYFRNSSNKARILNRIGDIYFLKRNFVYAYKYFDMSLQAVPGDRIVYMRLGDMAYYIRNLYQALRFYKLAYKVDNTDIELIVKLGLINYVNGRREESDDLFKRIQKFNPLITNIKEIIESIEKNEPINEERLRSLIEENTDLELDYKYNKEFKFPESKEELEEFRIKVNSVDAQIDFDEEADKMIAEDGDVVESENIFDMVDSEEKQSIENIVENNERPEEKTERLNEKDEKKEDKEDSLELVQEEVKNIEKEEEENEILEIVSEEEQELIEENIIDEISEEKRLDKENDIEEVIEENNIVEEDITESDEENNDVFSDFSLEENEQVVDEFKSQNEVNISMDNNVENYEEIEEITDSGINELNMENKSTEEKEEMKVEESLKEDNQVESVDEVTDLEELLKEMDSYIEKVQIIGRSVIQIKNIASNNKIPEDMVKRNILKNAVSTIKSSFASISDLNIQCKKKIEKLYKEL